MIDNTDSANNNGEEVGRKAAEAISIAKRIPGFSGKTEEKVLGMVEADQQEPTGESMVEEADKC